jgi:hypothetical protein
MFQNIIKRTIVQVTNVVVHKDIVALEALGVIIILIRNTTMQAV